jgi:hypothetical protein
MRTLKKIICVAAIMMCGPAVSAEKTTVDLALVLAVDVSLSIGEGEAGLQRVGYVHALRDKKVIDAIHSGPVGKIAITYVEWSSPYHQTVVVPWRIVSDEKSAKALADELDRAPIKSGSTTSISGAIDFCLKLLKKTSYEATRLVLDISGDGYSDYGRPVTTARDEAVKQGITINGLAVMNEDPKKNAAPPDLDIYFRDNVIGGPGSFYMVARNLDGFSKSVLHKLVLEIAGIELPPEPKGG